MPARPSLLGAVAATLLVAWLPDAEAQRGMGRGQTRAEFFAFEAASSPRP